MSSTNRGGLRIDQDKYYTPRWCIELLIKRIDFTKVNSFLEPCKGDGRILDFIPDSVETKLYYEIDNDLDYLDRDLIHIDTYDLIITNPPFSKAINFLINSLFEAKTVCYLQRLNWLGSQQRKDFWNENTPDKLFILSKRPQFMREMGLQTGSDSTEYAWFIWDKLDIVKGKHIEVI